LINPFKALFVLFSPKRKEFLKFKNLLGFYPNNLSLYQKAFRHKSATGPDLPSNERLEFLGDAVLGAVVSHFLFRRFPFKDEGYLSKMRSKIVSRDHLNKLALKLGIDLLIVKGPDRRASFKSLHGDAFEALLGAIYIDKGYDFTKNYILNRILKFHVDIDELERTDFDFKSRLINYCQKEKKVFTFDTKESGAAHEKRFYVSALIDGEKLGEGTDFSKKRAEQKAAEEACNKLGI
jgi:ribonuclease III